MKECFDKKYDVKEGELHAIADNFAIVVEFQSKNGLLKEYIEWFYRNGKPKAYIEDKSMTLDEMMNTNESNLKLKLHKYLPMLSEEHPLIKELYSLYSKNQIDIELGFYV